VVGAAPAESAEVVEIKSASFMRGETARIFKQLTLSAATAAFVTFRRGGKFAQILFRGVIELSLATGAAENIRLSFVFASRTRAAHFDFHTADGIFYCCCGHLTVFSLFFGWLDGCTHIQQGRNFRHDSRVGLRWPYTVIVASRASFLSALAR
jgi:hypothetical protein